MVIELRSNGSTEIFFQAFFDFEAYLSVAIGHRRMGLAFPRVGSDRLKLMQFFHPLLTSPVRNDFEASTNVALLSGPNMSGKSTLLKSVGLCVYLSHLGFGIPAKDGDIPYFDSITVAIDPRDDLVNGFSHFMREVLNVKEVALSASYGKRCFAVFDELFRGTNIEDAQEILIQTLQGLNQLDGSLFIISTHLSQLQQATSIEGKQVDTYYLECDLSERKPKFPFKLLKGWSETKVGRILFEQEGLPQIFDRLAALVNDRKNRS